MRKRNLKIQVAALAVTGAIASTPFVVRAEEASSAATSIEAAAPAAGKTETAAPTTSTTEASAAAGASTESTAPATTAVEAAETTAAPAPVTVEEPAVDSSTTVENNVKDVVTDDKQGTDISLQIAGRQMEAKISAQDANENGKETIGTKNPSLKRISSIANLKNEDAVLQGDLSIAKDGSTNYDTTSDAVYEVNKEDSYSLKADLDVTAVNNAIDAAAKFNSLMSDVDVDKMETGLRASFEMARDLDGSFHLPTDLEDAKQHYELKSDDSNPMIYRINYGKSNFSKDRVELAMDLDLSNYANPKEQISTFGNLNNLINNSAKKIQLIMKGIKFNSASSNAEVSETATEKTTTAEGAIRGTLVGYMKADVSYDLIITKIKGKASFTWGAIQNKDGRDFVSGRDRVAGANNGFNKVDLTVKMTTVEEKVQPVVPENPVVPVNPVQPVTPGNGGNGGNGGNSGSRTPIVNLSTPSTPSQPGNVLGEDRPTPSNQGEVLGENRPAPAAVETVENKGEVLGESRPSGKNVSGRAAVATGDNNFTALWASLFGLSAASLAGFVVLRKKEQEA